MNTTFNLSLNFFAGWMCFLLGAIAGAVIGLRFHREDWLGGYQSFRRRLLRLGHIAFFGLGFINILFALSAGKAPVSQSIHAASLLLAGGAATMPAVCFFSAWKPVFRHAFFIPVIFTAGGIGAFLLGWLANVTQGVATSQDTRVSSDVTPCVTMPQSSRVPSDVTPCVTTSRLPRVSDNVTYYVTMSQSPRVPGNVTQYVTTSPTARIAGNVT